MDNIVEAVFEDGVLRPLEKLALRPKQRVALWIDELPDRPEQLEDRGFLEYCREEGDANITLDQVRQALAVIPGSMTADFSAERDED
jgi:predicted DNA-binding antitoxin AbrB/MazE fold protein